MKIVNAKPEHFPQVYALICELEQEEPDRETFREIYARNLENPDITYLLALDGDEGCGFASLHIQYLLHHAARIAELQEIVVAGDRRGQGLGALLFQEVRRLARAAGCPQLEVCCNRQRKESHKFYLRQGMEKSHYKFTGKV